MTGGGMTNTNASSDVGQRRAHVGLDILLGAVGPGALLERLEGDVGGAGVGRLGARRAVEAGEHHRPRRRDLEQRADDLLQHRVGALDRASGRQLDRGQRIALVLRRDEAGRVSPRTGDGQRDQPAIDQSARASGAGSGG
jgi:hypothetical protein